MGWYHAVQMLGGECPSAKLCHIVEPWFLGPGAAGPGGPEFAEFAKQHPDVQFHKSLADVPTVAEGVKRLALISGRTADNPRLLGESIAAGCSVIYLEKPGELIIIVFCLNVHLSFFSSYKLSDFLLKLPNNIQVHQLSLSLSL